LTGKSEASDFPYEIRKYRKERTADRRDGYERRKERRRRRLAEAPTV